MKNISIPFPRFRNLLFIAALAMVGAGHRANAAGVTTWAGAGADQNWSTAGNWTTVGGSTPPAAGDSVIFRATGAGGTAGTINNIVDAGFTAAIGSLLVSNETSATFHTTQIPAGNTLTVNGPIYCGGTNQTATYTVTGGGTLKGGTGTSTFIVANQNGGTMTVDLSALSNFVFNAGGTGANFNLGLDAGFNSGGALKLAGVSNNITATTMVIGQNNNGGTATMLNLGAGTNIINANTIEVGWDKLNGTLQFNTNTGGLRLRNAAGTGRATVTICDNAHSGSAGAATVGTVMLNGHPVDLMIGTLTLANRHARSGGSDTASFSFNAGLVDVTNINMATNASGGTAPVGTFSIGGGTLKVANSISLVACAGAAGTGSLIITNGAVATVGGSIIKTTATGTGNVTLSGSTLSLTSAAGTIGTSSQPIDSFNLTNSTLHLNLDANNSSIPSIAATTINAAGANALVIDSIVNASGTITFPLVSYTGADPFSTLQVTLPIGYTGNLVDDTAGSLVQLTITAPVTTPLVWVGAVGSTLNSTWDTNKTKTWVDQATMTVHQVYTDPDPVLFDDTASNSLVTLATTNVPSSFTVNNYTINYTFNGTGRIGGSTSLNKQGSASLMLSESGGDNFSGGITVNNGKVILDDANSAITGGVTVNGGTTLQIGNNDTSGTLPSGTVDIEGTLVYSRSDNVNLSTAIPGGGSLTQNGSGKLTLSANNTYTGNTAVTQGTLALTGAGSVSNSASLLVSNATLDVSGATGATLVNSLSLSNSTLVLAMTNTVTPVNVFSGNLTMGGTANLITVTSLPPVAVYPATLTLIQCPGGITGYNFVLNGSSLPAGYQGTLAESADTTAVLLTLTSGPTGVRASVTWNGTNNVSVTTNWSDNANWQLPGAPGAVDNVIFSDPGTGSDPSTINNVVDGNDTIASLTYNQNSSGEYHVTDIPSGVTLTVSGAVTVGGLSLDNAITQTYLTGGGTFLATGSSFSVINFGSSGSGSLATLDLTGLNNFIYNSSAGTMNIANATSGNRFGGLLRLAGVSNNITAGAINLLQNNASNGGNGSSGLQFGAGTNIINVGTFNIVGGKNSGTAQFVSGAPSTAGLRIRGAAGNANDNSRADITIAVRTSTGTGTTTGNLLLNGNPVDIKAGTLTLGQDSQSGGNAANGTLSFDTGTVDATAINLGIAGNAAVTGATGTINVGATAKLVAGSGGITLANQSSGVATGNLNLTGGTVISSNGIVKVSTSGTANVSLTDGTLILAGGTLGTTAAPIDNLTLSDNGNNDTKIQLNVAAGVPGIAAGAINAGGMTTINIAAVSGVSGAVQIPLISYTSGDPFNNLILGTVPAGYTGAVLVDDTANSTVDLQITSPAPLAWVGAVGSVLNSSWDTTTHNWLKNGSSAAYSDPNFVQFDDSASNGVVTLAATVSPGGIDVSNFNLNYVLNGAGKISGPGGLVKQGSGTLVLDNTGSNDFSGGVNIIAGTLQIGNNDTNGILPPGNLVDNGALSFSQTNSLLVTNTISGSGSVAQINSNIVTLAAVNTYGGATFISKGTLKVNNTNALGSWDSGVVTINNGGTLDIGGFSTAIAQANPDFGTKQFDLAGAGVGGAGAIINSGANAQLGAFENITLTADATFGGPTRWDMRNGSPGPQLDLGGFTLTKTGTNQISLVSVTVTSGNININQGILSFETTSAVNGTGTLTVNTGGTLGHYRLASGALTLPITLNGGAITNLATTGSGSVNDAPITLTANSILGGSTSPTNAITLNGVISESGGSFGLTKAGAGGFVLTAAETYTGTTLVNTGSLTLSGNGSIASSSTITVGTNGTLDANGRNDQTLALNASQTLNGFGTVTGIVTTAANSMLAPGSASATGTLTLVGNTTLGGTAAFKLSKTAGPTNDVLSVNGTLGLGGTLNVTILNGSLAANDTFTLFKASGGISGFFTVTNLPSPGAGLAWDTSNLGNGILKVIGTSKPVPQITSVGVSGTTLTLTATNGQAGGQYVLLGSTNVALPINQWTPLLTNTFDGSGNLNLSTNIVNPAVPGQFFLISQ